MPGNNSIVYFDEARIDRIFTTLNQCHLPGAAVGVAIEGDPVYRKGFGLANMELSVALTPAMRMRVGSVSKHFTALAYLLLCEEGRASLDDPLGKHLPELHPVTHAVTMRQLLGHLGGLRDAHDIVFQFSGTGRDVSSAELLALYERMDDLNAAPGTRWNYSNGGYLLASAVIERVTGEPLETVLAERIFRPVGMHDTRLRRQDKGFVENSATLHMTTIAGGFDRSYMGLAFAGEGGVVSSVDDMLRWLSHMDHPAVGTGRSWAAMKEPQCLAHGASTGYGLGLIRGCYRGIETLFHAGGGMGGNAQMLKVPEAKLDIVVMTNRHDAWAAELANEILDACLPNLGCPRTPENHILARGVFRSPSTGRVIDLHEEKGTQIVVVDGFDWPYVVEDDGLLRPVPIWRFVNQEIELIGDRAAPERIRFYDCGQADDLVREAGPKGWPDVCGITGVYYSDTTDTKLSIFAEAAASVQMKCAGRFGQVLYRLEPLAANVWRARPTGALPWLGGLLAFDGEGQGLHFTSLRTWSLPFRRV